MTTIIGAAPSAIDTHVRLLEQAIGVSLLERAPRLTLTPAGKIPRAPPCARRRRNAGRSTPCSAPIRSGR
ncbi:LysR family transcriptional regulator [Burkholderia cepacia]|uniref:LysR family transcriptional regulator n=1 Tax=Burkholderia cepacia TaxID=292 RepID=UPI00384C5693